MILNKSVAIIIPVYNEERTIEKLLKKIIKIDLKKINYRKEIIVVNDGSTDSTLKKINHFKNIVILNKKNEGKGKAVQYGIQHTKADLILVQDGDLEYDPNDYIKLLCPFKLKKNIAVYGSRVLKNRSENQGKVFRDKHKNQGFGPYFMNKILQFIFLLKFRVNITDLLTGYKIYERKFFFRNKIITNGFETDHEISAKLINKRYKIIEVPINYSPRSVKDGKKIKFSDGIIAILTILRF